MILYVNLTFFDLAKSLKIELHIFIDFIESDEHFLAAVFEHHIGLKMQAFEACLLFLRQRGKMFL